ncbi:tumor necrosis factor receptor superfamily member 27 isoform 1-T1 [Hipposideros larvatus]
MDCKENEYWDQWGRCVTCQLCGPGEELSKDCGYGEGGDAYCIACPTRRYKSSWGHHRCQICITCAVINRVQKTNCTATSNAVCGDCLPRFYQKTRIGGLQDQECIPCTKQTPTSEVQCAFQLSLVKADVPTVPPQEATLVLMSSLLVVFTLAFLALFFLYCKQFFNRHCQHGEPEIRIFVRQNLPSAYSSYLNTENKNTKIKGNMTDWLTWTHGWPAGVSQTIWCEGRKTLNPCYGEVGLPCVVLEANSLRSCWVENEQVLPLSFNSWKLPALPHPHPSCACMESEKPGQWGVSRAPPLRAGVYFSEALGGETRERGF